MSDCSGQQIVILTSVWWCGKLGRDRFDDGCSELLGQGKHPFQWLQDPSEINGDNFNNIRCEASRHFRNKKKKYLKDRINKLATRIKNKNIRDLYRGINELKTGYQPRLSEG
jgi:hypothetical protein